jgi:hypothetical protein
VCIALVVTKDGFPLGHEVFGGNRTDVTTVEEIVEEMESRYGAASRVWVMDRGMVSQNNIKFLKRGKRRYIVGTPRAMLKKFERQLLEEDWTAIRDGLEVKLCRTPDSDGEVFILCRSADRREKEKAMPAGPDLRRGRPSGASASRNGSKMVSRKWPMDAKGASRTRTSSSGASGACLERTLGQPECSTSRSKATRSRAHA